jgi:hypothetical protein
MLPWPSHWQAALGIFCHTGRFSKVTLLRYTGAGLPGMTRPIAVNFLRINSLPQRLSGLPTHGTPFDAYLAKESRETKGLIKANYSKGWDAKPLAYVPRARDRVAGLPGEDSTS